MSIDKDFTFPSDEELNVEEVPVGCPTLLATAFHLGKYCEPIFNMPSDTVFGGSLYAEKFKFGETPFGYFAAVRIHKTQREKPMGIVDEYLDTPASLPSDYPRFESKYGTRKYFSK